VNTGSPEASDTELKISPATASSMAEVHPVMQSAATPQRIIHREDAWQELPQLPGANSAEELDEVRALCNS
jgi:hypothetical protein